MKILNGKSYASIPMKRNQRETHNWTPECPDAVVYVTVTEAHTGSLMMSVYSYIQKHIGENGYQRTYAIMKSKYSDEYSWLLSSPW